MLYAWRMYRGRSLRGRGGFVVTNIDGSDNCRTAYEQVCTSFHAIDDLRTKLLGFLPLVTGGGLILLTGRTGEVRQEFFVPFGLFGVLVTFGLLVYELNGMKRCLELIYDGEALESAMGLRLGQFITRIDGFPSFTPGHSPLRSFSRGRSPLPTFSPSRSPLRGSTPPCWPHGPTWHCSWIIVAWLS
jgi:hypothetical protein